MTLDEFEIEHRENIKSAARHGFAIGSDEVITKLIKLAREAKTYRDWLRNPMGEYSLLHQFNKSVDDIFDGAKPFNPLDHEQMR